jgi:hypothetical protein
VNGGETWTPISKNQFYTPDGDFARLTAAAIDPVLANLFYVAGPGVLLFSNTAGQTWNHLEQGLPPGQDVVHLRPSWTPEITVPALFAILTPGPHTLYRNNISQARVWTAADAGLPAGVPVRDLLVDWNARLLWAATDAGVYRSNDDGASWTAFSSGLADPRVIRLMQAPAGAAAYGAALFAGTSAGGIYQSPPRPQSCYAVDTLLCLLGGRFSVQLTWMQGDGTSGLAHARGLADGSGRFWFFSPDNTEVFVKMVDGGLVNGHSWFFAGGLSDLAYTLTVTDVQTGEVVSYSNPAGTLESIADTGSFLPILNATPGNIQPGGSSSGPPPGPGACAPARDALCLQQGRFRIAVSWQLTSAATPAPAMAVPLSQVSGAFWFFSPQSPELTLKVLDGRAVDGHFWIFSGGLSTLGYTLSVTDTSTGRQQSYVHAPGEVASELHEF